MQSVKIISAYIFTIIGSIIGAGFISGREILSFFSGCNIIATAIFLFFLFTFFIYQSLIISDSDNILKPFYLPFLLVASLIILSGMISALNVVFCDLFNLEKNLFFGITFAILSYFTIRNGIGVFVKISLYFVPFIIIFLIIVFIYYDKDLLSYNLINSILIKSVGYSGLNVFLSNSLLKSIGKNTTKKQAIIIAIITSFILIFLLVVIFSITNGKGLSVTNSPMPILSLVSDNRAFKIIYYVISIIAILSTLISSHYTLVDFFNGFKHKKIANALILLLAFAISQLGFYRIIDKIYPFLGFLGAVYIFIAYFLSKISLKGQRSDTSKRKACTK